MKIHTIVRPWGSSLGIILPREVVRKEELRSREEVIVEIKKKPDLRKIFGSLKFKRTAQKIKDAVRAGWKPEP